MKRCAVLCVVSVAVIAVLWCTAGCGSFAPHLASPDRYIVLLYDIYGKVTQDQSPSPLEGAQVIAVESPLCDSDQKAVLPWSDTTDENGDYRLENLPPGSYEVTFSHPWYGDEVRCVQIVTGDVELNVDMSSPPENGE